MINVSIMMSVTSRAQQYSPGKLRLKTDGSSDDCGK